MPWRLAIARTLAWALLVGGWVVLGALGHRYLPLWVGGLLPLALWLAAAAVATRASAGWQGRPGAWRAAALVLAVASAAALVAVPSARGSAIAVLACTAAIGWACLQVVAARAVRALRPVRGGLLLLPASLGTALGLGLAAPAVAGVPLAAPGAVLVAGLALALLLPRQAVRAGGCVAAPRPPSAASAALPPQHAAGTAWGPSALARLGMLPMMAAMPAMADWCSPLGAGPGAMWALHGAAMLLPAWALGAAGGRLRPAAVEAACALLLAAGALAWWSLPGLQAWLVASLLHAAAWSLAWALPQPAARAAGWAQPLPAAGLPHAALWSAPAAVLLLGWGLAHHGPVAVQAVQALLGAMAAGVWVRGWMQRRRQEHLHGQVLARAQPACPGTG
jgi:hypothetical protein